MHPTRRARTLAATLAAALAAALAASVVTGPAASGAALADCAVLDTPTHEVGNPTSGATLLTPWPGEADRAARYGFTERRGTPYATAVRAGDGLTAVHRFYDPATWDFAWAAEGSPAWADLVAAGYWDQGTGFWAPVTAVAGCTVPVTLWTRDGRHRYAVPAAGAALTADGWVAAGVAFHAAPVTAGGRDEEGDTSFGFAVMPDTQDEVGLTDQRLPKRVSWLLANREQLDLRWVLHSGDVHNWDTPDHAQYATMSARLQPLDVAGLPFVAAVGNHDTAAVCPGGSACPGADAKVAVRDTRTWNAYYPPSRFGLEASTSRGSRTTAGAPSAPGGSTGSCWTSSCGPGPGSSPGPTRSWRATPSTMSSS